jgi:hypothetical protein
MRMSDCLPTVWFRRLWLSLIVGQAEMRCVLRLSLVLGALAAGCSTNPNVLSPRIEATLREAQLDFQVQKTRAYTHWSPGYGHGLDVEVWVGRSPADYVPNLDLELSLAARVFAALARDDLSVRWDFAEVRLFCDFGRMAPDSRSVVGVADVLIRRETLSALRERQAEASEFPGHWELISGYKDQPDSKKLLRW